MSARILLTGGAGYIGSHTNLLLAEQGYETVVLDNLERGFQELVLAGELVRGDLNDSACLDALFADRRIDAVVHLAAYAYVGESVEQPDLYWANNACATLNLLQAMVRAGVDKLIFSSTCSVYGPPRYLPLDEAHPRNPINPYARTKAAIEDMLGDFGDAYGLKSVVLRYFNAAGADPQGRIGEMHDPETHLIPLAIQAALGQRQGLSIFGTDYETLDGKGDGTCVRDYIHINDIARAHQLGLEHLLAGGASRTYNLGNGQGYSVRQVLDTVFRLAGQSAPVTEGPRRPGDPPSLVGSSAAIARDWGWTPEFPDLETIVRTALNWHCKQA